MEVVAEACEGRSAVKLTQQFSPDVVVMDLSMPELNGTEATRQITARHPNVKVLAVTALRDQHSAATALAAGVSGYVLKDAAFEELVRAIRTVVDKKIYISPKIADGLVAKKHNGDVVDANLRPVHTTLTAREREVLQLMAEGKATKEIAAHLQISVKTVETYRRQIMAKVNLDSVAELTKYAVREGLSPLN